MNLFPLSRCASATKIVCPLESTVKTQPQLQPSLLRLSAMISQNFIGTQMRMSESVNSRQSKNLSRESTFCSKPGQEMKVHIARYPNALNHCRPITVGIPLSRPKTPSSWVYPRARKAASIYEQIKRPLPNVIRRRRIFLFPKRNAPSPFTSRLSRCRLTFTKPPTQPNRSAPSRLSKASTTTRFAATRKLAKKRGV